MAPWDWVSRASKKTVTQPTTASNGNGMESITDEDVPRSSVCTAFNQLSPRRTSYIDREDLQKALDGIFKDRGQLDFGIVTRSDRWAFWAPRVLDWAELKPYFPEVD